MHRYTLINLGVLKLMLWLTVVYILILLFLSSSFNLVFSLLSDGREKFLKFQ